MAKIKYRKEDLKRNELAEFLDSGYSKGREFWERHSQKIIWGAIVLALAFFVGIVVKSNRDNRELEARGIYSAALAEEEKGNSVQMMQLLENIVKNFEGSSRYGKAVLKMAARFIEIKDADNAVKILDVGLRSGQLDEEEQVKAEYLKIVAREIKDPSATISELKEFIEKRKDSSIVSQARLHLCDRYIEQKQWSAATEVLDTYFSDEEGVLSEEVRFRRALIRAGISGS